MQKILGNPRQIQGPSAFSEGRSSQEPDLDGVGTAEGGAESVVMDSLRRVLLIGLDDPAFASNGLQVEIVPLSAVGAAVAAVPQGSVAVIGRHALVEGQLKDLVRYLQRPRCVPLVCPDGADGVTIARLARDSGFEFVARSSLASRVASAARTPMREVLPVSAWAPARARKAPKLASALEVLTGLSEITVASWARTLCISRFRLYRLCMSDAALSANRLTWLCLRGTVGHLESNGHDPGKVHALVGYSSDRALRRALRRSWE